MGIIYTEVRLSNLARPDLEEISVIALADTGALDLVVPEHIAIQLHLIDITPREVTLADGTRRKVRYAGPIKVETQGRDCITAAAVMGDQVLLGSLPLEVMDMIIHPRLLKLVPNPENPNLPGFLAKRHDHCVASTIPWREPVPCP